MEDGRFGGGLMGASWWAELAEESGLTVTEIRERLAAGESIQDILTAAGLDAEAVIEALVNQARERHELAVQSGRLTQEQADAMLQTLRERLQGDAVWCSPRRCA
jgi:3-hydroxyacyl-CoA dehydrogenase